MKFGNLFTILVIFILYLGIIARSNARLLENSRGKALDLCGGSAQFQCAPGLINMGNTCYMGSILQSLYYAKAYREAVLAATFKAGSVGMALQHLFSTMADSNDLAPVRVTDVVMASRVNPMVQEDAQEFLLKLINGVDESVDEDVCELYSNTTNKHKRVSSVMSGVIQNYIKCKSVDFSKYRDEAFLDLSVEVQGKKSIEESLEALIKPDVLDGPNAYRTPDHGLQEAEKGIRILNAPDVLFVHLKRFAFDFETETLSKVNSRLTFPDRLDLTPYMVEQSRTKPGTSHTSSIYELQTVVVHEGQAMAGHYWCLVRPDIELHPDQWIKVNDHLLSELSRGDVSMESFGGELPRRRSFGPFSFGKRGQLSKKNAYILQYVRVRT